MYYIFNFNGILFIYFDDWCYAADYESLNFLEMYHNKSLPGKWRVPELSLGF